MFQAVIRISQMPTLVSPKLYTYLQHACKRLSTPYKAHIHRHPHRYSRRDLPECGVTAGCTRNWFAAGLYTAVCLYWSRLPSAGRPVPIGRASRPPSPGVPSPIGRAGSVRPDPGDRNGRPPRSPDSVSGETRTVYLLRPPLRRALPCVHPSAVGWSPPECLGAWAVLRLRLGCTRPARLPAVGRRVGGEQQPAGAERHGGIAAGSVAGAGPPPVAVVQTASGVQGQHAHRLRLVDDEQAAERLRSQPPQEARRLD